MTRRNNCAPHAAVTGFLFALCCSYFSGPFLFETQSSNTAGRAFGGALVCACYPRCMSIVGAIACARTHRHRTHIPIYMIVCKCLAALALARVCALSACRSELSERAAGNVICMCGYTGTHTRSGRLADHGEHHASQLVARALWCGKDALASSFAALAACPSSSSWQLLR